MFIVGYVQKMSAFYIVLIFNKFHFQWSPTFLPFLNNKLLWRFKRHSVNMGSVVIKKVNENITKNSFQCHLFERFLCTGFDLSITTEAHNAVKALKQELCFIPECVGCQVQLKCFFCSSNTKLESVFFFKRRGGAVKWSLKSGCIPCDLTWSNQMKKSDRKRKGEHEREERERKRALPP